MPLRLVPMPDFLAAFSLTVFAGLATGLGGLSILLARAPSPRLLASGLGLSAGVMLFVSFAEMMPQGNEKIAAQFPDAAGWISIAAFFGGIALIAVIDRFVPEDVNPHEAMAPHHEEKARRSHLMRTGMLTAFVITIHNIPEGFATLISGLEDPRLGLGIAVAVAIHNIPEGAAVAIPIYHATHSRRRAIGLATLSGASEPIGALLLYLVLLPFLSPALLGIVLVAVAGVMVFVSLDVLLPTAEQYGQHHAATYALIAGMAIMAVSLELISATN